MTQPTAPMPFWWRLALGIGIAALTTFACLNQDLLGTRGQAAIGIICFLSIAAMFSTNLRALNKRTLIAGIILQVAMALLILRVGPVREVFGWFGRVAEHFLDFSYAGALFVFGPLVDLKAVDGQLLIERGKGIFAFVVLSTVIFVSSFFSVLYFLGVLQLIVRVFARVMRFIMGTSGAETLSVAANVFMGQTEAPLIVKPYIAGMTRSELLALMIGGMAHISGALMAVYIGQMGADPVAIIATSVMAAPASLYICKILIPETGHPETLGEVSVVIEKTHANVIDAAAAGASEGMKLAINIAAMLIAFLAFIAMFNFLIGLINPAWSMQRLFAIAFSPVAVLMGVQGPDVPKMGELLGTKLVLNEFVAFLRFKNEYQPGLPNGMSKHAAFLAAFALTGFANFSSIGIQLGGIGGMAEKRRSDIAKLGFRALLGGFLATLINASIAGILM